MAERQSKQLAGEVEQQAAFCCCVGADQNTVKVTPKLMLILLLVCWMSKATVC